MKKEVNPFEFTQDEQPLSEIAEKQVRDISIEELRWEVDNLKNNTCKFASGTVTVTAGAGDVPVSVPFNWTGGYLTVIISDDSTYWVKNTTTPMKMDTSYDALTAAGYSSARRILSHDRYASGSQHNAYLNTGNTAGMPKSATTTSFTLDDNGAATVYVKWFVWA